MDNATYLIELRKAGGVLSHRTPTGHSIQLIQVRPNAYQVLVHRATPCGLKLEQDSGEVGLGEARLIAQLHSSLYRD